MDRIYLDHASTSPVTQHVWETIVPYYREIYGNASSVHGTGREARQAVERARAQIQKALGATHSSEIYFTSGGTESDNWALRGCAARCAERGRHIITTAVEHHAVLHTCDELRRQGYEITVLPVDAEGFVKPQAVREAIRKDTILVSVMMANNEIGTIEPVREIAAVAHEYGALMHTDAVQAAGAIPVNVEELDCDLLSLSGHKFGAPKGIGALYIRKGTRIQAMMQGGEQERHLRAGTENVPCIVGIGQALEDAVEEMETRSAFIRELRDHLIHRLETEIPDVLLNGPRTQRLPGNCNVSILGIEGESVLLRLDLEGIAASSGSACTAGSLDPSHVLTAIGRSRKEAQSSLRLTLGAENTLAEIDETVDKLKYIVQDLRSLRLQ